MEFCVYTWPEFPQKFLWKCQILLKIKESLDETILDYLENFDLTNCMEEDPANQKTSRVWNTEKND